MSVNAHRLTVQEADGHAPAPSIVVGNGTPSSHSSSRSGLYITDEILFNYQRCHRRAFLDAYGDQTLKDRPSDYLQKLRQDSAAHQIAVTSLYAVSQPSYPRGDWDAGAAATLALMAQGVDCIARGVLLVEREGNVKLVSCPDLLIKQPGQSIFGDWIYVPTEIKLGKRPKMDYQITTAYHAYVLAEVQGAWPETAWLVLRQRSPYAIDLVELLPKMELILDGCITMQRDRQEPEVFIAHNRCDLCHWYSHCYSIAQAEQHLSLLPGVTPSRYIHLKASQLLTVESLAAIAPERLAPMPGFGVPVAQKLVAQAQATLHNRAIARPASPVTDPDEPLLFPHELPTSPIELYFDIEAAPEQNLVYLHGVLVVDRSQSNETFYPLLADDPEHEGRIWTQFLELVSQYPDAPIYHFCPYEVQTVRRLAEYYGTPFEDVEPILERFVDLHERVTRVAILPVESYALKAIARWIGFDWRNPEANGAQSIYWYAQWLSTSDRTYLDAIVQYNEDDCRATYHVKNWLVEFASQPIRHGEHGAHG